MGSRRRRNQSPGPSLATPLTITDQDTPRTNPDRPSSCPWAQKPNKGVYKETQPAYSFRGNRRGGIMVTTPETAPAGSAAQTLSKAVTRAAQLLGIAQTLLASILGVSPATASRLVAGAYQL